MTKEEIIEFCEMKAELEPENEDIYEAIIKVLEQETILDKIKAEIEQIELLAVYTRGDIKSMALEIIDKYKEESEDKA